MSENQNNGKKSKVGAIVVSVIALGVFAVCSAVVVAWRNKSKEPLEQEPKLQKENEVKQESKIKVISVQEIEEIKNALKLEGEEDRGFVPTDSSSDFEGDGLGKNSDFVPTDSSSDSESDGLGDNKSTDNPFNKVLGVIFDYGSYMTIISCLRLTLKKKSKGKILL